MFKKSMIDQISISSKIGFLYAFEITVKAYLNDNKIVEIPYTWMMDNKKKSNFKTLQWLPGYISFLWFSFIANIKKKILKKK